MTDPVHILLIDDEPTLREPLAEYLTGQGFAVTEAGDAAKARTLMRDQRFSILLLDIMMPGEDGLSLCRHVAAQSETPVILLTAKGEAMDRIIGLEIGADDYVVKPFDPRELVARIKTVLRRAARVPQPAEDEPQGFEPLPTDVDFHWEIADAEIKATKSGYGTMLKVRCNVLGPTHVGRVVFAVEAWWDQYASYCDELEKKHAVGVSIALELRESLAALGDVIGQVDIEDVLDVVFSSFCIGK